ncbi:TPA: hypothetical protein ACPZCX_000236 [Citrobacter freundii]
MSVIPINRIECESGKLHEGIILLSNQIAEVAKTAISDVQAMLDEGWVDLDILRIHLTTIHDSAVFIHAAGESIDQGLS